MTSSDGIRNLNLSTPIPAFPLTRGRWEQSFARIRWLFAGLLNHWDNKGPAEIPPKRTWSFEHCAWLAHEHRIRLKLPAQHPFNPLPLLRLCIALGSTTDIVHRRFRYVWQVCSAYRPRWSTAAASGDSIPPTCCSRICAAISSFNPSC
jgi:hypothetical protein